MNLALEKSRARIQAKRVRAEVADPSAAIELIRHFPAARFRGALIGGFWPIKDEIDVRPLMQALHAAGQALALPCTPRAGKPLTFRAWTPDQALKQGSYGTREPFPDAPMAEPDILLMPLLAFTANGGRLGYGGGFYDRTLAALREKKHIFACGVAYAAQEAALLPMGEYDAPLNGILTEKEFRAFP